MGVRSWKEQFVARPGSGLESPDAMWVEGSALCTSSFPKGDGTVAAGTLPVVLSQQHSKSAWPQFPERRTDSVSRGATSTRYSSILLFRP